MRIERFNCWTTIIMGGILCALPQQTRMTILKPKEGDPFDMFPRNFWQDFSSPFTDSPSNEDTDEMVETTTHEAIPYFVDAPTVGAALNVSTHLGTTVVLHCRVNSLNGKTVSWVRRRGANELNLISFGHHTYTGDSRYALEFKAPNDWQLVIEYATARDAGHYECQVSMHPPLVLLVYLTVIVPFITIDDDRGISTPEKFYRVGSTIELKCIVDKTPQRANFITWKHGDQTLNYDSSRGGISVKSDLSTGRMVSRLFIPHATRQDTGNYTCALGNYVEAKVAVHVLAGENPAAMQHGNAMRWHSTGGSAGVVSLVWMCVMLSLMLDLR